MAGPDWASGGGLLSWGCQSSPLHRHQRLASTPSDSAAPKSCRRARSRRNAPSDTGPPSARSCHLPDMFRPCRSSRLRRFAPLGALQVCCTLKPIMGFATLQVGAAVIVSVRGPVPAGAGSPPKRTLGRVPTWFPRGVPWPELSRRRDRIDSEEPARHAPRRRETPQAMPWPFPVALHPSELSPPRQLSRVNRIRLAALRSPSPSPENR
jgi:hypothetical protein